jgi:hypothetical protein
MGNKIQVLLAQAKRESESPAPEKSSLALASRQFPNAAERESFFQHLREKLVRIEKWNAESGMSSYALFDENGNEAPGEIGVAGDYIRITLPGSGKSDWVKIIEIYESPDEMVLTVQPASDPTDKTADEKSTSHFFTSDSTNNFCLEQKDSNINFYVIGLSEKSNTGDTANILETIRNFATANLGHYLGIQKGEWTTFCENFLEIKEENN